MYMRKLFVALTLLCSTLGFSQALTDGTYTSRVYNHDMSKNYDYTFTMKDGIVRIDGLDTSDITKKTISEGNVTTMTWINKGGIWTENQTYIFTKDASSGALYLYLLRVVQNEGQIPWSVFMAGQVTKI